MADNKNVLHSGQRNMPLASNYLNIDRFVDHKPSIGAELGSNILLKVGRNFTIKSGLQFNYSRYSIKAYKFYNEKASIALNPAGRMLTRSHPILLLEILAATTLKVAESVFPGIGSYRS